jgi:FtsP/CotA-like multicopper oxidase with cupredoxin domain
MSLQGSRFRVAGITAAFGAVMLVSAIAQAEPIPGGSLDPTAIPKYETPLVIPPAIPMTAEIEGDGGQPIDYYEIAVRQFEQHILPGSMGLDPTTVWSYGSVNHAGTFNYPAFTIEATWDKPVRVNWINGLVDADGNFIPHLLPVDQTLHWANPIGPRDSRGFSQEPYQGPVPMVVHVHGADTGQESDGYTEAWYLPAAADIPDDILYTSGTFYDPFKAEAEALFGQPWAPGTAVFQYPNDQRATTLWYHDHSLGMTRLNVYAGPAGFYIIRGGPDDEVDGKLPGPAPMQGDHPNTRYYEIPIVIQDRSFNDDGSLFYPDNRAFFEGLEPEQLQIPFIPDQGIGQPSDVPPIWNPEFFGNVMVTNGKSWPYLEVEQRRYRFRYLNGCNSRFLILRHDDGLPFYQIGAEGGFLPEPIELDELLIAPAERADVIVDFSGFEKGDEILLLNVGPDDPFGGGEPGVDFDPADPGTTGQVMLFKVVKRKGQDKSTPPMNLVLPEITPLGEADNVRQLSLNEEESKTVRVVEDEDGNIVFFPGGEPFGPTAALLGTLRPNGEGNPLLWNDAITENPMLGDTEVWEIYNFTEDAHPIHIHLVQFEVVDREDAFGTIRGPESWETGFKDTVIAYPGEITRVKAQFNRMGLYVWHCHILEHEDNEMMRPYYVGPMLPIP